MNFEFCKGSKAKLKNKKDNLKHKIIKNNGAKWYYYKKLPWNFKYYRVQIKKVSYWHTSKQSMSNHVSRFQDMRFLLAFS